MGWTKIERLLPEKPGWVPTFVGMTEWVGLREYSVS
jgi:hypothetical protein